MTENSVDVVVEVKKATKEHLDLARIYEKRGNAEGARQLRAVANLLSGILMGNWSTILPKPDTET